MPLKMKEEKILYFIFAVSAILPVFLLFNNNIWFDESYTLALTEHDYHEIIEILKTDMHPPMYFIALKIFCDIFGYSVFTTKIFSLIAYEASVVLGMTVIKNYFSSFCAAVYMIILFSFPMSLYFSVQQRSYSWCIFFITLCFIEAIKFTETGKNRYGIIFVLSGLCAAYNHIFALLAAGIIFAFINLYSLIKKRSLLKKIIFADIAIIAGYVPWLIPLINQTKSAAKNFWLKEVDLISVILFIAGTIISVLILIKKKNRNFRMIFAVTCVMGIQAIGLGVTIFIRPFYIARYCVVVLGIFSLLVSMGLESCQKSARRILCIIFCMIGAVGFIKTFEFEYNHSMKDFFERCETKISDSDKFIYCDSSFGMIQYYLPENEHLVAYQENWFSAFKHIKCVDRNQLFDYVSSDDTIWLVKNQNKKMPDYIKNVFNYRLEDNFRCDFNDFELYSLTVKD